MSTRRNPAKNTGPGRRTARVRVRRLDATVLIAIGLPLLALLAAVLVSPGGAERTGAPPEETALTKATVICPSGGSGAVVATDSEVSGQATVRQGREELPVELAPGRPTEVDAGKSPLVVSADGELAPGLLAGRPGKPLVAAECRPPVFDEWFTGVGAGAKHSSVLELVNPDAGPAIVDAVAYGRRGPVDADLRGMADPGRSVVRVDLSEQIPRRDELALHVTTVRGRVSATVLDGYDELGAGKAASDYLPSQPEPAMGNLLLGLPEGKGRRTLLLANPAETEARASIKVVTEEAVFAAVGSKDVVVPPQSVARVSMSSLLRGRNADDALGLLVESSAPVTATARLFVDGDLTHLGPAGPIGATSLVVPPGEKRLVLGGASRAGAVRAVARDAAGEIVADKRVEVAADRGAALNLPDDAVLLTVTTNGTPIGGSVVATGDGVAVLRLRPLLRSGLVADVRPGLP
jgi:hypothetical protein